MEALWERGFRFFGAFLNDELAAVTVIRAAENAYAETEFTSVAPDHRQHGLGAGVKAASILALAADGVRVFGTGGTQVNEASLAMNRAVGYVVEERWLSYAIGNPSGRASRRTDPLLERSG